MFTQLRILALTLIALSFTSTVTAAPQLQRRIAADAVLACGPPNNSNHKIGSSCAFKFHGADVFGSCIQSPDAPNLLCEIDRS